MPREMPPQVKATTIRFSDEIHAEIELAARKRGASFASYVREAACARLAWEHGYLAGTAGVSPGVEYPLEKMRAGIDVLVERLARVEGS